MKALVITSHGEPSVLQLQERPQPEMGADEVLIQVKAAGVNRPDVSQRKGHYFVRGLPKIFEFNKRSRRGLVQPTPASRKTSYIKVRL